MNNCEYCNATIPYNVNNCPACGAPCQCIPEPQPEQKISPSVINISVNTTNNASANKKKHVASMADVDIDLKKKSRDGFFDNLDNELTRQQSYNSALTKKVIINWTIFIAIIVAIIIVFC